MAMHGVSPCLPIILLLWPMRGSMSRGVERSEALESGVSVLDVSLLRGGHGERDPLHRRLLPLLRDRLDLGEELHASLAVEIQISCE